MYGQSIYLLLNTHTLSPTKTPFEDELIVLTISRTPSDSCTLDSGNTEEYLVIGEMAVNVCTEGVGSSDDGI
jgi:hypothetical protein